MKPILSRRQWRLAVVVAVIVVGLGIALLARHNQQKRDRQFSGSCANHSSQLKLLISTFMSEADRFPLETNARIAFMIMSQTDPQTQSWLSTAGAACPE
jgi:anti-sigma-K factor RskA